MNSLFIEADPDPADQNEMDPNGFGSATLEKMECKPGWPVTGVSVILVGELEGGDCVWPLVHEAHLRE